jgi:hypothetical protein
LSLPFNGYSFDPHRVNRQSKRLNDHTISVSLRGLGITPEVRNLHSSGHLRANLRQTSYAFALDAQYAKMVRCPPENTPFLPESYTGAPRKHPGPGSRLSSFPFFCSLPRSGTAIRCSNTIPAGIWRDGMRAISSRAARPFTASTFIWGRTLFSGSIWHFRRC